MFYVKGAIRLEETVATPSAWSLAEALVAALNDQEGRDQDYGYPLAAARPRILVRSLIVLLLACSADVLPKAALRVFQAVSGRQQVLASPAGRPGRWSSGSWGPLEVWDEGAEVSLGGPKPRALLAVLLLHPNEVVPADRLIDELWGEDSPEDAAAALRVNVSRLRKALPQDVLTTRSPGYVIRVEPDELDLHRFERLVDEGRSLLARGLATDASERLRDALSLWRGPALADFAYESFAQAAIARLEEIRLAAVELRIDADLALGRHDELVGELEALVAEHPLRERLRSYLMTALYRSGRQAEALDAYQDARRALVDELGIEPSPALQELERAILRQDPSLDLEATAPPAGGRRGAVDSRRRHGRDARRRAARGGRAARATPASRPDPGQARVGRGRASGPRRPGSKSAGPRSKRAASWPVRPRSRRPRRVRSWLGSRPSSTSSSCSPTPPTSSWPRALPTSSSLPSSLRRPATWRCSFLGTRRPRGRVLVPFGGAEHDWAAVELGAWFARANDAPLRLAGAAAVPEQGKRDASRLLSHGALAVQRVLGISAEPLLTPPGEEGHAGGEPRRRPARRRAVDEVAPRGPRPGPPQTRQRGHSAHAARAAGSTPGGLAPPAALTRFTWSIRP